MEPTTRSVLSNGLVVLLREVHAAPVATFWAWYRVGSRNEVPGITGISHWVEHMLFKGTPTLGKGEFSRLVNRHGGSWNGFTWKDFTAYFETLPAEHIGLGIQIESDRMTHSLFDPEEVESERTVIISEREGAENNPEYALYEEVEAAAYRVHTYRHAVIGYKSDLLAMTRDDLIRHYRTYYTPNNAVVVAVGDFDSQALLARVREAFEPIPAGPKPPAVRSVEPPQEGERRVMVRRPGGAVPQLQMAFHAPAATDPDFFSCLVLDGVLSGFKGPGVFGGEAMGVRSSRLYRALVEQQLTVDAGSSFRPTLDPTLFEIGAALRPGVPPERVEAAVLAELRRLCEEPVGAEELDKVRKQARAQWVYAADGVSGQAVLLGSSEIVADCDYLARFLDRVTAVTPEAIRRAAANVFAEANRTVGWYIPEPARVPEAEAEAMVHA
ncbi:MAG: insulinase family protein [Bacillati bacterium ANGP1]|uniref:Insulinase family protein n=1 Tax=Candidatus Segetimicrobium genomatis TaxID=2569760 RepID=A0A537K055_9BACT|nr:MAG: insulinase family protein [Terrabacteria group bacterium ANGP1]